MFGIPNFPILKLLQKRIIVIFLNNVLFDPYIRDDDELVGNGFYNSDLLYLNHIKLIHEKFQGVEDFYFFL